MKPFIKWAGGKTQLLPAIREIYPQTLGGDITKYCEPFVGAGAVLLDVLQTYNLEEILINDINPELTNLYNQVKNNVTVLVDELAVLQQDFWEMNTKQRKVFYYKKRSKFNNLHLSNDRAAAIQRATLFIFLNKTCFNGLYRVNSQGYFNVPIGSYKMPLICDKDNLMQISNLLQKVTILTGNYKRCLNFIDENTFVYIDPPYRPLTQSANFTAYTQHIFGDKQQIELATFVDDITAKGAKFGLSNSDPTNIDANDLFFDNLYSNYNITRVEAKRMISRNASGRGAINELLIFN